MLFIHDNISIIHLYTLSLIGVTGKKNWKAVYVNMKLLYLIILYIFFFFFIAVDKMTHMVGSYPPKTEIQSYTTPAEDAPAGVMARGSYSVSSLFTDDDKHEHLKWEWSFEIKKDWKE